VLTSGPLPGPQGTMKRMGFEGYWAALIEQCSAMDATSAVCQHFVPIRRTPEALGVTCADNRVKTRTAMKGPMS